MTRKPERLSDAIRRAIIDSSMSRYAICKKLKIDEAHMLRFMRGEAAFSQNRLDEIGLLLGLRIVWDEDARKESD